MTRWLGSSGTLGTGTTCCPTWPCPTPSSTRWLRELEAIEDEFPVLLTADSPTQQVGSPLDAAFPPFEHLEAMMSLDNVFSEDDLRAWSERVARGLPANAPVRWSCELKIDGTAINCVYRHGVLAVGATRGTGAIGETVTPAAAHAR